MRTRRSNKVRVVEPPKCSVPYDTTREASTRSRTERKQKENSQNLQELDKLKKKSIKTIQNKLSEPLQNTKQAETSTRLLRGKGRNPPTQNKEKAINTSKPAGKLVRKAHLNNNNKPPETVTKRCYVLLQQLPEDVIKAKLDKQKCDTLSKLSQDEAQKKKVKRNVAFDAIISQDDKILRKRKTMNYAESSLEMSQEKPPVNRVPVYKLNVNDKTEAKPHEDTYEFDSSDCEKRAKKKRRKRNDSSSDEYNKTIENILKNIAKRVRKRKNGILPKKNTQPVLIQQKSHPRQPKPDKDCNKNVLNSVEETTKDKDCNTNILKPIEKPAEDDFNDCFTFKENAPKIKILSDIHLNPTNELNLSLSTPSKFRDTRPNANSTMIGNNILTPWRFNDINIRRNPHFITLKESSLPCISQEMVLDHSIVDKFSDHSKLNTTNQQIRKTPVQKRVTDYFVCNGVKTISSEDKENLHQVSLFDDDMFSPIKSNHQINNSRVESVKRKILGEKTDDNVNVSTPIITQNVDVQSPLNEASSNKENSADNNSTTNNLIETNRNDIYFGFDSLESDDQVTTPKKNKNEKPFRLSVKLSDKKYTRKPKQNHKLVVKKRVEAGPVVSSDDESDDTSVHEEHNGEYRLFDDFDDTFEGDTIQEPGIVKKKRTRRRFNLDGQNEHHLRRKDMRTKEEEEEAEKWATAFNSLCEEIEEFPLEIE